METHIKLILLFLFIIIILLISMVTQLTCIRHRVNDIKFAFRKIDNYLNDINIDFKTCMNKINLIRDIIINKSDVINQNLVKLRDITARITINTNDSIDWLENIYRELNEFIYTKNNIKNKKNKSNFDEQDKTAIMTYLKVIYENINSICKTLDKMNRVPSKPTQTSNGNNKHKKEFADENFNEPHDDI